VRHRVIEERCSHGVPHGKLSRSLHEKTAVLERAHCIGPRLAARIDEAAVDPARDFIYLQSHVFRATSHKSLFQRSAKRLTALRSGAGKKKRKTEYSVPQRE